MADTGSAVLFGTLVVVLMAISKDKRPLEKLAMGLCITALFILAVMNVLGLSANAMLVVGIVGLCLCCLAGGIVLAIRIQDSNWLHSSTATAD